MKKTIIMSYLFLVAFAGSLFANEVNIFSARHYDSDVQLYEKFTAKTGIKVNVVSGKSGALEKKNRRIFTFFQKENFKAKKNSQY